MIRTSRNIRNWETTIHFIRNLIDIESIEDKVVRWNWSVSPHAHSDFLELFLIEKGGVELFVNGETVHIDGPAFFMIPKNVLHGFYLESDISGWVFILSDRMLENMLMLDAHMLFVINDLYIASINASNPSVNRAYFTMRKLVSEFSQDLTGRELAIQHLTGMLLLQLSRIPQTEKKSYSFYENADMVFFRRFEQLIKTQGNPHKTIEAYCEELSVSTKRLSYICHNVSGKNPKEIAVTHFIGKAKIALCNFEKTVAEVAYELNFEDPYYFSRLFKKKTGFSPKEFRYYIGLK